MENKNAVSEEVYEELKMIAATGETCVLQFRAENGAAATAQTKIQDVFEDEDGRYLLGENGLVLQLHQLISINGKPLQYFC